MIRPPSPPTSSPGSSGRRGQGSVYLGLSPSGEQVAVKLLHTRFAEDERAVRRFLREADSARRVAEFCTARVLDVGEADGRPYIVGEYVDGPSLQQQVSNEGPLRATALVRLAVATATALAAIHRAGVIHRDFKPGKRAARAGRAAGDRLRGRAGAGREPEREHQCGGDAGVHGARAVPGGAGACQ
ncbi:hypothetical protein GCM10020220_092010 [Nonomuraea rubra]|uniref:protein kinase domain-containing protein n=1 Tax=Nonomuraea rubra TaxID=46180 RepID=UPI0031E89398